MNIQDLAIYPKTYYIIYTAAEYSKERVRIANILNINEEKAQEIMDIREAAGEVPGGIVPSGDKFPIEWKKI